MKRLVTFATVLLVGLASVQAAQTDDQQKKKKKKAETTQTTSAQTSSGAKTSSRHVSTQTNTQTKTNTQTSNKRGSTAKTKPAHSNTTATHTNTSGTNTQQVKNKSNKKTNVVVSNNAYVNKKTYRHFKRSGNEVSFSVARTQIVRTRHDRGWWNQHYSRIVFYGGGYWYWNAGWWYPAWGYNPYYSSYIYDGPIYGYGYARPGDVTAEVQRALAARGYYYGPIDGILGPGTRSAIRRYQIDRGLYVTAAIDEPTLATLGLT